VTEDIDRLQLNTDLALHVATRDLTALGARSRAVLEPLVQLVQPFAPHLAECCGAGLLMVIQAARLMGSVARGGRGTSGWAPRACSLTS
jgi:hypothetical protein